RYCMPAEGLDWLKKDDMLAGHEIVRLADIAISHLGIEEIRFTGGEPLVRADLVDILDGIHTRHPQVDLSRRTNGLNLERKINALLFRGIHDHEANELLTWTLEHGYKLRFIEQMPVDADHNWTRANMVTAQEIRDQISQRYTLTPHEEPRGSAPAELFNVTEP